jgi:RNA polymerase sigma factor (sigma-70 family)
MTAHTKAGASATIEARRADGRHLRSLAGGSPRLPAALRARPAQPVRPRTAVAAALCYGPTPFMRGASEIATLIAACAAGDGTARRAFQDRYGADIYNFPVKIYRTAAEEAADFYVYVFERDRIFARLATFEGRNNIQFRTFLGHYVLRSLFFEWQRNRRDVDTVSLNAPAGDPAAGRVLEDVLADPAGTPGDGPRRDDAAAALWSKLSADEQLDLKLLSLLEHELTPDDVRRLAEASGRSLRDTLHELHEVLAILGSQDRRLAELREQLDTVWGWIVLRRRELHKTEDALRPPGPAGRDRQTLVERQARLQGAVSKRLLQRERLLEEIRELKLTTPYKLIARLRNLSVGTVCSRIFRLRQRLAALTGDATLEKEAAP